MAPSTASAVAAVACLCCLWLCTPALADDKNHFDYFILSREWPFSFCDVEQCTNKNHLQSQFNIHGLWPQQNDGGKPMFCHAAYNETQLQPILDELRENWMDLRNPDGNPHDFWKTEFKKHGSCAASDRRYNSTLDYFNAALQLHKRTPLLQMLEKEGIRPGDKLINVSSIRAAITKNFGFEPSIRCAGTKQQQQRLLYELRLCFGKDLAPRNCSSGTAGDDGRLQFNAALLRPVVARSPLLRATLRSAVRFWPLAMSQLAPAIGDSFECPFNSSVLLPAASELF